AYGDLDPARAASRFLILSNTSGLTRPGPHTGPCPTRNSRATARSFSRQANDAALRFEPTPEFAFGFSSNCAFEFECELELQKSVLFIPCSRLALSGQTRASPGPPRL